MRWYPGPGVCFRRARESDPEARNMTVRTSPQCANPGAFTAAHPLEMIPVFRRIPQSTGRDLVYTLIWNQLFALAFTLLNVAFDPAVSFGRAFFATSVIANCIGFIIHFEFLAGDRLLPGIHSGGLAARTIYYSVLPIFGVFAGYAIATSLLHIDDLRNWVFSPRGALMVAVFSVAISSVLLMIFIPRERAARLTVEVAQEKARVAAAEKQATLAQLKLLEAQVEPHFLYNTLANVVSLVDRDPATAKAMIERLIALLRGAAAAAGAGEVTLAAQIDHLRAYLDLIALRMGGRLVYRIDVPSALGGIRLPPLVLQPLVENAIRHGLEPKIGGGEVAIAAHRESGELVLTVADDGVGFAATKAVGAGGGLGLSNLRERLAAVYGGGASLIVEDNRPTGARITLRLPGSAAP